MIEDIVIVWGNMGTEEWVPPLKAKAMIEENEEGFKHVIDRIMRETGMDKEAAEILKGEMKEALGR